MPKPKLKAFTLIELLVVIVIIGILATLIIVNVSKARKKARLSDLQSAAKNIATAAATYSVDHESTSCISVGTLVSQGLISNPSGYVIQSTTSCGSSTPIAISDGNVRFKIKSTKLGECWITVTNGALGSPSGSACP